MLYIALWKVDGQMVGGFSGRVGYSCVTRWFLTSQQSGYQEHWHLMFGTKACSRIKRVTIYI